MSDPMGVDSPGGAHAHPVNAGRDAELEQRIRERAYEIWEQAGRSGDAVEHWLRAERELTRSVSEPASSLDAPGKPDQSDAEGLERHLRAVLDPKRKAYGRRFTEWARTA